MMATLYSQWLEKVSTELQCIHLNMLLYKFRHMLKFLINININLHEFKIKAYVIKNLSCHIIIGNNFYTNIMPT